jgi:hypothetical protein
MGRISNLVAWPPVLTTVVLVLLSGCATQAQRQYQAAATNNKEIAAQFISCTTAVANAPEAEPIRGHVPIKATDATLVQLSDSAMANKVEIAAILVLHPRIQECQRALLNGLLGSTPSFVPILTASYNKGEDDVLMLVQHKLTWGEYNKRRRDRATEIQAEIQSASQQLVGGLQHQHEAELAQRQRAAEALAQWAQTQQMINAVNRPIITNCNEFGSMLNCVSR